MKKEFIISANHPIVTNHKAYDQELLPGLAYIDMLYQFFHDHGHDFSKLELRNLSIYRPLFVSKNGNLKLLLIAEEISTNQWSVQLQDGDPNDSQPSHQAHHQSQLYIKAEMYCHQVAPAFTETLNIQTLQASSQNSVSLADIYAQCRSQGLVHSGIMKADGIVYKLDLAQVVNVSLPRAAQASATQFMFHPTLIDGGSVGSSNLFATLVEGEQRLFLPLFFESFRVCALFSHQCFIRVKTTSVRRKKDMIFMDLEFFNESGHKVAELKNFVNKLVREAAFINPNLSLSEQGQSSTQTQGQDKGFNPDEDDNRHQSQNLSHVDSSVGLERMETLLKEVFASSLGCSLNQIEIDAGYYELGMDSPMLLDVVSILERKLSTKLIPTLLFEYTTIEELATHFIDQGFIVQSSENKTSIDDISTDKDSIDTRDQSFTSENLIQQSVINQGFISDKDDKAPLVRSTKRQIRNEDDIAIIGMAGRYPEANNINEFWQNLTLGKDCIREVPLDRWDWRGLAEYKSPSGKSISKWGGFIQDHDCFDHQFFRISPREAEVLDPQERLFLQTCWECIEDAGYTPETLALRSLSPHHQHSVGVFVGVMHKDYTFLGAEAIARGEQFHLSINNAPIANRVSYFCDFHGPSIVLDTVCSSSLTAVHLAVESIKNGESEVALAGGVNLSIHPSKYMLYGSLDMYSSDGRCRTFGRGGDGYVSGEGVGAVLLKPLKLAISDRDHIYAVIKGSTINHVGKVTGISVPNASAQADMILQCLEKTGIDPRTITYVEAHGTGTSLGDPIEIQGLSKAFRTYTSDTQYCAIGSVKSNIGHTESAAGISGLSKVALQLYHKTLVPSLHSNEINPLLNLDVSPFYVQHQTQPWEASSQFPRRAGLSAFGATGSNAHIILEEYVNDFPETDLEQSDVIGKNDFVLIPLSAKNEDRLKAVVQNLYHYLESELGEKYTSKLRDIAYTLQVGRRAMETRLIFIANGKQHLLQHLNEFLSGNYTGKQRWFNSQVKQQKHSQGSGITERDLRQGEIEAKLEQIAQAWIQGFPIDWPSFCSLIYSSAINRISLPTYPFARVRHWVPMEMQTVTPATALHPLLHRNTSILGQQRFSSTFSGMEFFLADHRVRGQKILPGVAYLEMARVAAIQSSSSDENRNITLKNIIWQHPLVIDDQTLNNLERTVFISLAAKSDAQIRFEIHTGGELNTHQQHRIVHCQGLAFLESESIISKDDGSKDLLDIDDLQEKINQYYFSPEQCYQAFQEMGIEYGEAHRGITGIYVGTDQLLAELTLPTSVWNSHEKFGLHPSLLDSALQAAIGFGLATQSSDGETKTSLPYALESLEIRAKCHPSMWVWIRYASNNKVDSSIQKFDLDLCDRNGNICVQMRGFSSRVASPNIPQIADQMNQDHPLLHQHVGAIEPATDQFVSRFTGEEFFLRDHQQVMLGMAYLEMAHRAGQVSSGQTILGLKNIIWNQLLYIAEAVQDVSVYLHRESDQYRFQITTQDQAAQQHIHCQGKLVIASDAYPSIPDKLDIQSIKSRCPSSINTTDCDRLLQSTHGPSLLTITQFWYNDNEALALLQFPGFLRSQWEAYTLHPSMINGAILSSIVFSLLKQPQKDLPMPFALEKLWIYQAIPEQVYAYVSVKSANKHDIELVDENGEAIVSLKGFTASTQGALQGHSNHSETTEKSIIPRNILYGTTTWHESALVPGNHQEILKNQTAPPIFFLTQGSLVLQNELIQHWPTARIETLTLDDADPAAMVQTNFLQIFRQIKAYITTKSSHRQPIVILIPDDDNVYLYTGYSALLKTACFENNKIVGKVIRYAIAQPPENFSEYIAQEIDYAPYDVDISYTQIGTRKIKQLDEVTDFTRGSSNDQTLLSNLNMLNGGDVVLITGGLGGLGQIFAKYLSQIKGLKLVLSGRSSLDSTKAEALHQLQQGVAEISYLRCDISDQDAVTNLIQSIQAQYGKLNGVIHSAGLNLDSYIFNKTTEEIIKVMQPKISGVFALDKACQGIQLNFMVLFSSIAGVFGSIGQADYATANAFLDSFAEARNLQVRQGKCFGKTLSINWPLWKEGGMGVSAQDEVLMEQNTGMIALETIAGLSAFDLAVSSEFSQILVTQGNVEKIRSRLFFSQTTTPDQSQISTVPTLESKHQELDHNLQNEPQHDDDQSQQTWLIQVLHKDLITSMGRLQKLKPEDINLETEFSNYGFDSIGFTSFANVLNDLYGLELMPTLFFECSNVRSLADFLLENHRSALLKKYKPPKKQAQPNPNPAQTQSQIESIPTHSQPFQAEPIGIPSTSAIPVNVVSLPQDQWLELQNRATTPIAIIGMSGKFPGSENLGEFWQHLEANHDLISEIPEDRWNWRDYYGESRDGKTKAKWGGFINNIDCFDPLFFGISPVEAELMDPQFRLFLETVWATIEDAGYKASALSGQKIGVYMGVTTTDYKDLMQQLWIQKNTQDYLAMYPFMLANRVSYIFNFRGPSEAIDTACSSSLVAIHRAIESIRQGSCEMAIAGGVNIIANPQLVIAATQGGMLSEDGRCKTFDKSANGYVRGEGVGAILLKPLAQAIADHDLIHGVIRGSAENHGGKATSPTAPNPVAQQELLISAYTQAGISPKTIGYIEAHGTGTPLGDPIEINGLKGAFTQLYAQSGSTLTDEPHCALGSVKTNIGHLEAAAGISGVLKVLLMMKHQKIPGNSHLKEPNPYLQLANSPFFLIRNTQDWLALNDEQQNPIPRRAGVSSFGIGGTNVHLILEEYCSPSTAEAHEAIAPYNDSCIILSARDRDRLIEIAQNLYHFLIAHRESTLSSPLRLADIAYTLQIGREEMDYRLGFVASSLADLEEILGQFISAKTNTERNAANIYEGCVKEKKDFLEVFGSDEDLQGVLAKWFEGHKYEQILKLWVNGLSVNWEQLYRGKHGNFPLHPRRISLPSYSFARERYWLPSVTTPASISPPISASETKSFNLDNMPNSTTDGCLFCCPIWKEKAGLTQSGVVDQLEDYSQQVILWCGINSPANLLHDLRNILDIPSDCYTLQIQGEELTQNYQVLCEQIITHLKQIIEQKTSGKVLVQIIISGPESNDIDCENSLLHGLAALLKTAHLENPQITGQLIEIDPHHTRDQIIQCIRESSQLLEDIQIRYCQGRREVLSWQELPSFDQITPQIAWKEGGVYLITGGVGGLGLIFARDIACRVQKPTIVLVGRSPLTPEKQAQLQQQAQQLGARIDYRPADISQRNQVQNLIQGILHDYGKLDGILHGAGVINDSFILKKSVEQLQQVFAPKVQGTVYLDQATKDLNLDFFVLFSSGAAVVGNAGQVDYAAANAFMDAYAHYRHVLVESGQRFGRSLSINWPLWQDGGMQVDGVTLQGLALRTGIKALQTENGVNALLHALSLEPNQIMVLEGDRPRLRQALFNESTSVPSRPVSSPIVDGKSDGNIDEKQLLTQTINKCKNLFGQVIKLDGDRIDPKAPLENYGIDSVIITQMNHRLEGIFGEISKTVLYEYQTLEELANYLITEYRHECFKWTDLMPPSIPAISTEGKTQGVPIQNRNVALRSFSSATELATESATKLSTQPVHKLTTTTQMALQYEPIAIIGMVGRYAQAETVQDYWQNLRAGRDCVTEIPPERWSLDGFYHEDLETAMTQGKSYSKWGSFITDFADFDPLFFSISPREAAGIDPQERLFLQSAWAVLEDAGYTRDILRDQFQQQVGVFVGITKTGFNLYGPELWRRGEVVYPQTSFSSVANRISYLLNLRGPSLPIDTMCSSSLTAIHEACEHIRRRECELAIAGGVNLYLHPSSYIQMCAAHMLSQDGQCKSFGAGGNGFVPGEGVGTVLLKPLDRAIADRDHIYAVIRGSSVNHGGKTNGYTVPNPKAQAELIESTLSKAGIDARTISYIEAHGTGTELGDPIEITGLTQAFQQHTTDTGFCAVGSAKSNLGHLEAAAGIAGLTKIILQLQHGQLVPSLHATELNPNINFAKTPFVVQQTLSTWERLQIEINGEITTVPRRAGISSFGAGGSNAHLIVEEYIADGDGGKQRTGTPVRQMEAKAKDGDRSPQLIVLSARNEDRLHHRVQNLRNYLDTELGATVSLDDLAYTLQTGREAMAARLALVVDSLAALKQALTAMVAMDHSLPNLYRGQVKPHRSPVTLSETFSATLFDDEEEIAAAMDRWLQKGKLDKIAQMWCQGLAIDWHRLHQGQNRYRISLPTYPFEAKKYWIKDTFNLNESLEPKLDEAPNVSVSSEAATTIKLHPLIHENTSSFYQQRFSSNFSGEEFFLADHRVQGERVLPGVAYLEMARMAIALALDEPVAVAHLRFFDVVWPRAIVVGNHPVTVHTALQIGSQTDQAQTDQTDNSITIHFEIYTTTAPDGNYDIEPVLHCQGWVEFHQWDTVPALDLSQLQHQCQTHQVSATQCYQVFASAGIQYGPGHQAIETLYVGQQQVLAKLTLPLSVADTADQFGLHPSLLDAALQASLGLAIGRNNGADPKPSMPYALENLELYETEIKPRWAWIRESSHSSTTIQKLDVDLCDDRGRICLRLRGFSSRVLERTLVPSVVSTTANLALLSPVWNVVNGPFAGDRQGITTRDQVLVIGGSQGQKVAIEQTYPDALWISGSDPEAVGHFLQNQAERIEVLHIIWIGPEGAIASLQQESLITDQNIGVLYLFRLLKVLLACGYGDQMVQWTVITTQAQAVRQSDRINPTHAAIHGLMGSLAKEYPHWPIRLVDLDANQAWPINDILRLPADQNGDAIAYRGREWFKQTLVPITEHQPATQPCYRSQGVYVVIGGAGGIGAAWSQWMIEHYQAQIIWLGRRPKDESIQSKLDSLAERGIPPHYIAVDASDRQALQAAYQQIKRDYGPIHGVIHSAIVLADRSLANMDESLFQSALQAKVDVSVRLAQVFAEETLDFVLFFSSTQSFAKMPGQSNYAAGCTFKDAFAQRLAQEWSCPVKVMNWSYWGSVGIVASSAYRDRMAQMGVGSIEPHEGMAAIQSLLQSPLNQLALIKQLSSEGHNSPSKQQELTEWITTYEEDLPDCMDDLQTYLVPQSLPRLNFSP